MRLLVDENVHSLVVARLRDAGYEVEFIAESMPGTSDEDILGRPDISNMLLTTYDSDFGELIFKRGLPTPNALIFSRLGRAEPRFVSDRIIEILEKPPEIGMCYIIGKEGTRTRPFAAGSIIDG